MNRFALSTIASLVTCVCTAAAAQAITKENFKASVKTIEADYQTAKAACGSFKANAKDICIASAKGTEKVAIAEAEMAYEPGHKSRYNLTVAKAEAIYSLAREKCDDKAGNVKDVCVKEAKAAQVVAKADAKALLKTAQANTAANETSAKANTAADKKVAVANKDAASDKRDAEYALAAEKCNALASSAKDACVAEAKAQFGKS
jgi:hypothetical protein